MKYLRNVTCTVIDEKDTETDQTAGFMKEQKSRKRLGHGKEDMFFVAKQFLKNPKRNEQ